MQARFPLILFDLDGTLVDSFEDIIAGIRVACAAIGVEPVPDLCRLATRGIPLEDFYLAALGVAHDAPAEAARFAAFVDAYRACYLPGCVNTTRPYPGIPEVLEHLRALTPRPLVGVATTKRTETAERVLEGSGLAGLVDVVAGSDGMAHKPDPAVLRRVAELAGVDLRRAVMVGDTDRDVGAARAAGCVVAGVTWGGFSEDEMRALAPDWLVRAPGELIKILTRR